MKEIEKSEARKVVSGKRKKLSSEENADMSERIRERLFGTDEYTSAESIYIYVSFNNEPDTYEIISRAWDDGKTVFVPCTGREKGRMDFVSIESFDDLSRKVMGISEPEYDLRKVSMPDKNALVIMPGVAFDEEKNRAGYGGGYYDKWLEKACEDVKKTALAFEFQVFKDVRIMTEAHDIRPDHIVTEERVY